MWLRLSDRSISCWAKLTGNSTDATDKAAREELWISFRSLLQAYLAAATAGTEVPQALVVEPQPRQLQIVAAAHTVTLEMRPETGEGYWAMYKQAALLDEGTFRLHLDASFEWSGKPGRLEMDAVAEALATLVLS